MCVLPPQCCELDCGHAFLKGLENKRRSALCRARRKEPLTTLARPLNKSDSRENDIMRKHVALAILTIAIFTALPSTADEMSSTSSTVTNDATGASSSETTTSKTESSPAVQESSTTKTYSSDSPGASEVTKTQTYRSSMPKQKTTTQTETQVHY